MDHWITLGPSLCAAAAPAVIGPLRFASALSVRPSSNLGFFFGPGLPLGLSSPSACADVLFTPVFPFFLIPSTGGGIVVGSSVPLGAGVFAFDSDPFSPGDKVVAGSVLDAVVDEAFDDEGFDSDSFLMTPTGSNGRRLLGDSLSVIIMLVGVFLGLALLPVTGDDLTFGPILGIVRRMQCGWDQSREVRQRLRA